MPFKPKRNVEPSERTQPRNIPPGTDLFHLGLGRILFISVVAQAVKPGLTVRTPVVG